MHSPNQSAFLATKTCGLTKIVFVKSILFPFFCYSSFPIVAAICSRSFVVIIVDIINTVQLRVGQKVNRFRVRRGWLSGSKIGGGQTLSPMNAWGIGDATTKRCFRLSVRIAATCRGRNSSQLASRDRGTRAVSVKWNKIWWPIHFTSCRNRRWCFCCSFRCDNRRWTEGWCRNYNGGDRRRAFPRYHRQLLSARADCRTLGHTSAVISIDVRIARTSTAYSRIMCMSVDTIPAFLLRYSTDLARRRRCRSTMRDLGWQGASLMAVVMSQIISGELLGEVGMLRLCESNSIVYSYYTK